MALVPTDLASLLENDAPLPVTRALNLVEQVAWHRPRRPRSRAQQVAWTVTEAAVIGVPDELRGEVVEAFVVLRPGRSGDDGLVTELQQLVKDQFAAHAYPRRVHVVAALPKTPSGKIQRFRLREAGVDAASR